MKHSLTMKKTLEMRNAIIMHTFFREDEEQRLKPREIEREREEVSHKSHISWSAPNLHG